MKRTQMMLAGVLACAASGSAIASASEPAARTASAAAKIELRHTHVGSILTTSSGFTLYEFTRDHGSENSCVKLKECPKAWPALETGGKPVAGPGVKASLLSTITIAGGVKQVTYAGHPLYTYIGDTAGSTDYVGAKAFGGSWYALSAAGSAVK